MLADPMVRLATEADSVSETQICQLYSGLHHHPAGKTMQCLVAGANIQ
ncbi:hypothetical protein METH_16935 [Leisingera methylohalidivorans DSM 14336]|uniref:Uncharacterized protein n=1 Tax=Leisingera methylohalidivorans DSM 14336 TaxID=999552 RepID=V9W215_9RHOB|nr:hypothetical protein METH_16935 [Leisingera methylohalidivorans DSM 14336]